ncbi:phosphatidylinositol mannoside acyltransferase [Bifidobacterium canis]|uniref:Lauroyl acyltransferase n=1 Tax=Bifidobacterium canis TaxID=2610880 RepID=A0A7K1J6R0_9BIFI|nr:phosphatidylinositol mannoside acyltransferase [Bifidobacterium canis]MUH60155.1 lauroyl acyltransferase [Bifidobacterium canis]
MFDKLMVWLAKHPRVLPERVVRGLFLAAADGAWLIRAKSVRQLERNLSHVLAWEKQNSDESSAHTVSHKELRALSRKGMRSYFTYFSEAMSVGARSEEELRARIRGAGEGLLAIQKQTDEHGANGSAPIAMGHQGNWDYDGFWAQFEVAPVTTVAERLANEAMLRTFVNIREELGMTIFLTGTPHLTEQLEDVLREPHTIVPLLADRDLSRHGEFVHAFGSMIRVARGPATIAFDTGLPLFVVNTYREKLSREQHRKAKTPYGYVCEISGPIDVEQYRSLPREEAIHEISQRWVDIWARGIAAHPQDWHMLQPIFAEDLDLTRLKDVPPEVKAQLQQFM